MRHLAEHVFQGTRRLDRVIEAGRELIGLHVPAFMFLLSYALTMVLGNVLYFTSVGIAVVQQLYPEFKPQEFEHFGSPGYWALLLLPLLLLPAAAMLGCRIGKPVVDYAFRDDPLEIHPSIYVALVLLCHVYCGYVLYRHSILMLNLSAHDMLSSIQVRFEIQERVGFAFRIIVNAILPLLIIYALVRALRLRCATWWSLFAVNAMAASIYLILLNMKWPILVLWVMIFLAVLIQSRSHHFFKATLCLGLCVLAYLTVSALVFRLGAVPPVSSRTAVQYAAIADDPSRSDAQSPHPIARLGAAAGVESGARLGAFVGEGIGNAAQLFAKLINRMASSYPIYYEEFTAHGFVCGTLWDRLLRRSVPCAPSTYLYRKTTTANDPLRELGTIPAPVNVSGYALGGWLTAAVATGLAGVILGLFAAFGGVGVPSATRTTIWIMGGQVGYFFSQLSVEGPIVYDHGAFWWGGVLLLGVAASAGVDALAKRPLARSRARVRAAIAGAAGLFVIAVLALLLLVPGVWNAFWPGEIRG